MISIFNFTWKDLSVIYVSMFCNIHGEGFFWFNLPDACVLFRNAVEQYCFFRKFLLLRGSRDSVVGIATRYGLEDQRFRVRVSVGSRNISYLKSSTPALGSTQSPVQWVPGLQRSEREVDHSPPTSAEVKKMWFYTSTPTYAFMA
jgi:hypothetical protein